MPRKPRPDPLEQGDLREIYTRFFAPLIVYKPELYSVHQWMETLFSLKDRDINLWRVKKHFRMPGLLYLAPYVKIQGIGYRPVKVGTLLCVRQDKDSPFVDVEYFGGQGKKDQVFALDESEWGWVKLHLEDAERLDDRR